MNPANAKIERKIITGMIVHVGYLRKVIGIYNPELITLPYARTVAKWCIDYYKRYEEAPGKNVQELFNDKSDEYLEDTEAEIIQTFLEDISDEYEKADTFNYQYLLDKTEKYFRKRALEELKKDIATSLYCYFK